MSFKRCLVGAALIAVAVIFAGCVDNEMPPDDSLNGVPGAIRDPNAAGLGSGVNGMGPGGVSSDSFAEGAGGAGTASGSQYGDTGWTPVEGVDFPVIYFDFDKDEVKSSEMEKIQQVAKYMADYPELGLIIEGHTDDVGTNEYNRVLGERRAISTMNAFGTCGFPAERIQTISYGEDKPAANGTDAQSRAMNRRAMLIPAKMQ